MYTYKFYYNDEKLRLIDASQLNNENDEYIVLFQRDAIQNFIDCYYNYYFTLNDCYYDDVVEMCEQCEKYMIENEFYKIVSKYKKCKIINYMYFDFMNYSDTGLFFIMYENNDNFVHVDIYEIEFDIDSNDEFYFDIDLYEKYLFKNKYNAMKFLFDYNDNEIDKKQIY